MIPQTSSLVKYSNPVLISISAKKTHKEKKKEIRINSDEVRRTEDILGEILPPKEYQLENGQLWIQTVLSTPATRIEVVQLQEELDKKLAQRGAREIGICPIKEELYEQCFDELIRQITIDCRQRGLLLVRVRNEYDNQLTAYKNLYESGIGYGMRKLILSDSRRTAMQKELAQLDKEAQELERDVQNLTAKIELTKKQETEKLAKDNEAHKMQVAALRDKNSQLKQEIQKNLEEHK